MREKILGVLNHPLLGLGQDVDFDKTAEQVELFLDEWKKWNDKINLTSEKDAAFTLNKHIFDSFQYYRAIKSNSKALDIGSGAGFPGIPLKILFPELEMVLVESQRKRASFLASVISKCRLERIRVCNDRAENLEDREGFAKEFDCVLFRSVGKLKECISLGEPFLKAGGRIIIKKSPGSIVEEIEGSRIILIERIPIKNLEGQESELLILEKCST